MGIKEFLQDEGSVRLGQLLGGVLSLKAGRELARFVADIMTRRGESGMVQNIMANQWVVSGGTLSGADLEKQAGKVMRHITRSLFDYFYFTQHLKEARGLLEISPRMQEALRESIEEKKPTILLGPHLGSFEGLAALELSDEMLKLEESGPDKFTMAYEALKNIIDEKQ